MSLILPNSTIGVFGSGQLGRMLAVEARKMGYRISTFSPRNDTPTGHLADSEIVADYNDLEKILMILARILMILDRILLILNKILSIFIILVKILMILMTFLISMIFDWILARTLLISLISIIL